jgi:L-malate glycosyltransferase
MDLNHLRPDKTILIYHGVAESTVDAVRMKKNSEKFSLNRPGQIVIGTAAWLNETKGLKYLIRAVAQLVDQYPQLKLVIAGQGELEADLYQEVVDLDLSQHVVFTGYVEDLHNLLNLFKFFVLPSLQEPFSLVCTEAISMGKTIIGTAVGGFRSKWRMVK